MNRELREREDSPFLGLQREAHKLGFLFSVNFIKRCIVWASVRVWV
jgi:hypothetical protein